MNKDDKLMIKVSSYIPKFHYDKIKGISKVRKFPISRMIAQLIDKELDEDKPFSYDLTLASEESVEYAYAEQATKLLNFLAKHDKPIGLDVLVLLRHHIGIPCRITFLGAFQECLSKEMIEPFKIEEPINRPQMHEDYYWYRLAGKINTRSKKLMSRDAKQYEQYQKLKKKFEKEDERDEG